MSFQSVSYAVFLAVAWAAAVALPWARFRQLALLAASYVFYVSFGAKFAVLLLGSSVFNYLWGRLLRCRPSGFLVWTGVLANLALLAGFKYVPAALAAAGTGDALPPQAGTSAVAALGISFFTFQALSYLLDVYRRRDVDPTLPEFLLYMAFWPTIVSGPICRAFDLVPQFRTGLRPSFEDVSVGCHRIIVGLFMKVVLADTLARGLRPGEGVDFGFDRASALGGADVALLAVGFGFQLFFDFAGYSNIAIGSARLFGFRLPENFDRPYLSRTVSAFWTRWHMSLSFWIRDYLFMPLATLRPSLAWRQVTLVISMTLFGVWHGAAPRFALWGLLQGLLLVVHRGIQQLRRTPVPAGEDEGRVRALLSWGVTFGAISLAWILFRAKSLSQAAVLYRTLFTPSAYGVFSLRPSFYLLIVLCVSGYFLFEGLRSLVESARRHAAVRRAIWLVSPLYHSLQILAVIAWSGKVSTFVYSRF